MSISLHRADGERNESRNYAGALWKPSLRQEAAGMYGVDYAVAYLAGEILCLGFIIMMTVKMNGDVGAVDEIHLFRRLSVCSILQIIAESVWVLAWSFLPGIPRAILYLACLQDLLSTGLIVCFWYIFLDIKLTPRLELDQRTKMVNLLSISPLIVLTVLDISSLWNHQVFYLDGNNDYVRGGLYFIHSLLCFSYFGASLFRLWLGRRQHRIGSAEERLYLLFSNLLVIGGIFQIVIGRAPFTMFFFTLGMFFVFSSMQSRRIDTDALTKLNNHGRGISLIRMHLSEAEKEPFYLFIADINGFKKINDTYGHIQGDQALLLVADTLRRLSTPYQSGFVARYGGDEFVFAFDKSEAKPQIVTHRLAQLLSEMLEELNLPFRFTMSVGYALADREDISAEELIAEADQRLYMNKREYYAEEKPASASRKKKRLMHMLLPSEKGLPERFHNEPVSANADRPALNDAEMEQYILEHLDKALDSGWIVPYFQPLVRTITDRMSGAEALARWEDPVYGVISPASFVPVLEKAGLIYKIDCAIYTKICQIQSKRLVEDLPVIPVSVNLSRQDFDKLDMVAFVINEAKRFGVSRDLISLEITESVLVQNKDKMMSIVKELRGAGFEVWMDDFGSGYSSLIFLNDYTLDLIKLDMAFLQSFSKTSKEIMKSAVAMAKRLGIRTLAEGVETPEHVRFLKEIGCDLMQGYYFSKPLSAEDMRRFMLYMRRPAETIEWKSFYDKADACVIHTDMPMALMEYNMEHDRIRYLFINHREREQLRGLGRSNAEESAFALNNRNNPLHTKLMKGYKKALKTGDREISYVVENSCLLRVSFEIITAQENRCIILASMVNVTADSEQREDQSPDQSLADIALLFDDVHVLNPGRNTASTLINNFGIEQGFAREDDLRQGLHYFKTHMVHPEDRERYWDFADPDTMLDRLKSRPDGILRDFFRVLLPDDNRRFVYKWEEFNLLLVPGSDDGKVLSCIKGTDSTGKESFQEDLSTEAEDLTGAGNSSETLFSDEAVISSSSMESDNGRNIDQLRKPVPSMQMKAASKG